MIDWSPTKLKFTLGIGSLASVALLGELAQKAIPAWMAVGIVIPTTHRFSCDRHDQIVRSGEVLAVAVIQIIGA